MPAKKTITIVSEPVDTHGMYEPHQVKTPEDGMRAALHMIFNHTADVFKVIVDVVAEHYKLDKGEMMNVIVSHPKYEAAYANPVLNDLGYNGTGAQATRDGPVVVAEEKVPEPVTEPPVEPATAVAKRKGPKKVSEMTPEELEAHRAKVAERKAKKAETVVVSAVVLEPVEEPPAAPAPKVIKTFQLKPKKVQVQPQPSED